MKNKIIISIAVIIAVLAVFFIWRSSLPRTQGQAAKQTATLEKSNLLDSVLVSGTVTSGGTENVYSKVTNYPVKEVYFEVGDKVKADDILARLNTAFL